MYDNLQASAAGKKSNTMSSTVNGPTHTPKNVTSMSPFLHKPRILLDQQESMLELQMGIGGCLRGEEPAGVGGRDYFSLCNLVYFNIYQVPGQLYQNKINNEVLRKLFHIEKAAGANQSQ